MWTPRQDEWERYLTEEEKHATRDEYHHIMCYGIFTAAAHAALEDALATLRANNATTPADTAYDLLASALRTLATVNARSSMLDAFPRQLTFLEAELARLVTAGAWEHGTACPRFFSRLFVVPKPGVN
eukprot:jgi/Tetstr1/422932/TSEL_013712.t1